MMTPSVDKRYEATKGLVRNDSYSLPVIGAVIGLISTAGDASVSAMIVSTVSAFPFNVISTESLACLQVALPPVRLEQPSIFAGRAGSESVLPAELRICR